MTTEIDGPVGLAAFAMGAFVISSVKFKWMQSVQNMPQANLQVQPVQALDADNDPFFHGPPVQYGFGRWKVSRLKDIRAVHADPDATVDKLSIKAIRHAIHSLALDVPSIMVVMGPIGRDHRTPNDDERKANIVVTKRFLQSIGDFDFDAPFSRLVAAAAGSVADASTDLAGPLLDAWRAEALGMDARLGLEIETDIMRVVRLLDFHPRDALLECDAAAARILAGLDRLDRTPGRFTLDPVLHWAAPAFTAMAPLRYTCISMLAKLADAPDLQEQLRAAPALRPGFIQEAERLYGAFRYTPRQIGPRGLDLGDAKLPPRCLVQLDLAAANRDPETWEDPDAFRMGRPRAGTATFGFGPLGCTGGQVSRRIMARLLDLVMENVRLSVPDDPRAERRGTLNPGQMRGYSFCPLAVERL